MLGDVLAGVYLSTGSLLLLPVLLHAAIDLRFLLVPASDAPPPGSTGVSAPHAVVATPADWTGWRRCGRRVLEQLEQGVPAGAGT